MPARTSCASSMKIASSFGVDLGVHRDPRRGRGFVGPWSWEGLLGCLPGRIAVRALGRRGGLRRACLLPGGFGRRLGRAEAAEVEVREVEAEQLVGRVPGG